MLSKERLLNSIHATSLEFIEGLKVEYDSVYVDMHLLALD